MEWKEMAKEAVTLMVVAGLFVLAVIGIFHIVDSYKTKPVQTANVVFIVYEDNGTYHLEERYEYAGISPAEREILFKSLKEDVEKREQHNTFPSFF